MNSALLLSIAFFSAAEPMPAVKTEKEALQPFNIIVGPWKATGFPEGTREERSKGFWIENLQIGWKFQEKTAAIVIDFKKGKYYTQGELHYDTAKKNYRLTLQTVDKKEEVFLGELTIGSQKEPVLTVDRTVGGEDQRITFTLLHANRFLYAYSTKPSEAKSYTRQYQVGATKEGEPFAEVAKGPECIVSGGRGSMAIMHNGKTYYVCCSGCRDAFKEEPEKYIAEYEKKQKEKK